MRGFPRNRLYENIDTGELLTYAEMIQQAESEYDFDDWTSALELWEIYQLTEIPA